MEKFASEENHQTKWIIALEGNYSWEKNSAEIYKCHFKCSISSKRKHTIKVIQLKQKPSR